MNGDARSGRAVRVAASVAVAAFVAGLGVWAQNAALVGVNYDDAIYALLGKALAVGDGYRFSFLPTPLPAVKYPPLYPLSLVPFWKLAGSQGAALLGMKLVNGIYVGLAAGLFVFLLAELRIMQIGLAVVVALLGFASGSMMLVSAGVLSEPLYLVLLFAALYAADGAAGPPATRRLVTAGLLAALVTLTRTVGVALIVALALGAWRRWGRRAGLVAGGVAVALVAPWLLFTLLNAGRIPDVLVPRYGSYLQLYLANLGGSPGSAFEIFSTNVGAILQTLGGKLVPQLGPVAGSLAGALLLVLAALGSLRIAARARVTALYPWLYLGLVSVWSFPPFRFLFILYPLLLALAAVAVPVVAERTATALGRRFSGAAWRLWPRRAIIAAAFVLAANLGYREARAVGRRVWDGAELDKSATGAEVIDWVQRHAEPGAVIAYEFDPMVALHTGRKVVPNNYEPVHLWYRRDAPPVEPLARMLSEMGVSYVAVRHNVPLAAAPIDALLGRYPGSLRLLYVAPRGTFIFKTDLAALGGPASGAARPETAASSAEDSAEAAR